MPGPGKSMTFTQRLSCAKMAAAGQTDAEIAQRLGWSKWSVRKWRRVYEQQGEAGLVSRMGRPAGGPLSTFAREIRDE